MESRHAAIVETALKGTAGEGSACNTGVSSSAGRADHTHARFSWAVAYVVIVILYRLSRHFRPPAQHPSTPEPPGKRK